MLIFPWLVPTSLFLGGRLKETLNPGEEPKPEPQELKPATLKDWLQAAQDPNTTIEAPSAPLSDAEVLSRMQESPVESFPHERVREMNDSPEKAGSSPSDWHPRSSGQT